MVVTRVLGSSSSGSPTSGPGPLLDSEVGRREGDAAPFGEGGVRLEALEALAQLARYDNPADERAAPLLADDLARVLEPLERRPQRPARDPEHLRDLVLRRQPVTGPMAAGREPVARCLLRAVDQRLSLGHSAVVRTLRYSDTPMMTRHSVTDR